MVLQLTTIVLGIFWGIFGYQIYQKKKYHRINRYVDGKLTEKGASTMGKIEMIYGMLCVPAGMAMFFMPDSLVWICFIALHVAVITLLVVCARKHRVLS